MSARRSQPPPTPAAPATPPAEAAPARSSVGRLHAAVLVAALGASAWWFTRPPPPPAPPAAPPADLLTVLPTGPALLATVDVEALRRTPAGASLLAGLTRWADRDPVAADCGFDPAAGVRRLALAVPSGSPTARDPVFAAVTAAETEQLARCAARVLVRRGTQPVRSDREGFVQVRGQGTGAGPALAVRADGLVLLGGAGPLADALDATLRRAPNARDDAQHAALRAELTGSPAVAVTLRLSPGWVAAVAELDADAGPLAAVRGVAVQAEGGAELALAATLVTTDARAAAVLLAFLQGFFEELAPALAALVGAGPGRSLTLAAEGATARVTARLTPAELERALGALALLAAESP